MVCRWFARQTESSGLDLFIWDRLLLLSLYYLHYSYHKNLELAKNMGSQKALLTGLISGFTYLVIYLSYALAFWYGTTLILSDEYTFGKVLIVSRWRLGQSTIALFPLKLSGLCTVTVMYALIQVFYSVFYGAYVLGEMSLNIQYFAGARVAAHKIYSIIDEVRKPIQPDSLVGWNAFKPVLMCLSCHSKMQNGTQDVLIQFSLSKQKKQQAKVKGNVHTALG